MSDQTLADPLKARRYETADPASFDDLARNAQIAAFDRLLAETAGATQSAAILPLRANSRR